MAKPNDPDGKAKRVRTNFADAGEAIHDRIADKITKRKNDHLTDVLERFEADYAPHLAAMLGAALDDPATPAEVRPLLAELASPTHFSSGVLTGIALGAALSPVIAAATAPLIQTLANAAWTTHPTVPIPPETAAALVIKGVMTEGQAGGEAALNGISPGRFAAMVLGAGQSMGIGEALLLLRRKQITDDEFVRIIHYSNVRNDFIPDIRKLMFAPPAAGTVIAGALKGWLTDAEAKVKLGEAGIDPTNFDWLKDSSGRPPGIEQMLHLWNRDKVTQAQVDQAIRQSDVNDNYLEMVHELRWYVPPVRSILPMLRAESISEAKARELFTENGVRPEDIDLYLNEAKHTKATGPKEITGAQVIRMYSGRFLARADAQSRLAAIGYPGGEVTMLLDFADDQRTEKLANALASKVGSAYIAKRVDKAEATSDLTAGGIDGAAQTDLFHVWDLERSLVHTDRLQNALIAKVGGLYVAHKIDKAEATAALTAGPIPAALQTDLFHVWDLERTAAIHHPTAPQVMHAYRQGLLTAPNTKARLLDLGVQDGDLVIVVANGYPPTAKQDAFDAVVAITGKPPAGIGDPVVPPAP